MTRLCEAVRLGVLALAGVGVLVASCVVHRGAPPGSLSGEGTILASDSIRGLSTFVAVDPLTRLATPVADVAGEPVSCAALSVSGAPAALMVTRDTSDVVPAEVYRFYLWRPDLGAREVTVGAAAGPSVASDSAATCVVPGGSRIYLWEGPARLASQRTQTRTVLELDLETKAVRRLLLHRMRPSGDVALAASRDGALAIEWDETSRWDDGGLPLPSRLRFVNLSTGAASDLPGLAEDARDRPVDGVWWSRDGSAVAVSQAGEVTLYRIRSRGLTLAGPVTRKGRACVPLGWSAAVCSDGSRGAQGQTCPYEPPISAARRPVCPSRAPSAFPRAYLLKTSGSLRRPRGPQHGSPSSLPRGRCSSRAPQPAQRRSQATSTTIPTCCVGCSECAAIEAAVRRGGAPPPLLPRSGAPGLFFVVGGCHHVHWGGVGGQRCARPASLHEPAGLAVDAPVHGDDLGDAGA